MKFDIFLPEEESKGLVVKRSFLAFTKSIANYFYKKNFIITNKTSLINTEKHKGSTQLG